jgi:hypothetical protein
MKARTTRGAGPAVRPITAGDDGSAPASEDRRSQRRMSANASRAPCCGCCAAKTWSSSRHELGVTVAELSAWRDAFLAAGEGRAQNPGRPTVATSRSVG